MKLVDPARQAKIVRDNDPGQTIRKGKPVKNAVEKAFSGALFSLSEIAFDKNHRHAAVSYSLWCGSLCGHGNTLIFEKIGNEWKKTDRSCGGWISLSMGTSNSGMIDNFRGQPKASVTIQLWYSLRFGSKIRSREQQT